MLKTTVKKYISEGSKINQVIMATLMVFPAFSYGMAVGWLSPMGSLLMSEDTPAAEPMSSEVISWMASVPYLVGTPSVFLFGYLVDNCGRKAALMFTSSSFLICWSLKAMSTSPWALILARGVVGLGVAGSYVVMPLYIKEISEDSVRGTLGSLVILSQNLGNLVVYVMGEYMSYHAVLWTCLAVPLLHMLLFVTMPESPSYLLKCGKLEEARDALAWLRCRQVNEAAVDCELTRLRREQDHPTTGLVDSLKTIARDKATSRAFRITLTITLGRELCGCLAVLHFASMIFEQTGGAAGMTANHQAMVLGAIQLLGSFTASTLVEKTGRKPLLGATCLGSGLALITLGTWFYLHSVSLAGPALSWLPIASLCLCIYCDAAGLQPVPFVIMTEIFPFQLRGTVTSLVISVACALVSVELRVFQPLAALLGIHVVFWSFAGVCLATVLYIVISVPETKMRSLNEIYDQLAGGDSKRSVTKL